MLCPDTENVRIERGCAFFSPWLHMNGRHVDIVMIHWKETCVLLSSLLKNHKSVDLKHITIQMSKCNKRKSVSYQRFWMGYLRKGRYQRGDNSAFLLHTFSQFWETAFMSDSFWNTFFNSQQEEVPFMVGDNQYCLFNNIHYPIITRK